jgi:hypothetical protein
MSSLFILCEFVTKTIYANSYNSHLQLILAKKDLSIYKIVLTQIAKLYSQ